MYRYYFSNILGVHTPIFSGRSEKLYGVTIYGFLLGVYTNYLP